MLKKFKLLKDQRGLTLIELLVVVVILGIIAGIAVPSVGGLIDNSKKDAHAANATQMISAAKLAVIGDNAARPTTAAPIKYLSLAWLQTNGYLEVVKDPDGTAAPGYVQGTAVTATPPIPVGAAEGSHVKVTLTGNAITYEVFLSNGTRGVRNGAATAINGSDAAHYVAEAAVSRGTVQ